MSARDVRKNLNAFVDGRGYAGQLSSFTPPYPAEHITFRSHLVNDYLTEILPATTA